MTIKTFCAISKVRMRKFCFYTFFCLLGFAFAASVFARPAVNAAVRFQSTYDMPYPGMLPDNPLYFLKAFRDRVVSILISDPLKKAEFDLLNSDKRLSSGITLLNEGKNTIAVTTISKSNNYFDEAVGQLDRARQIKEDTQPLKNKMQSALAFRQQALTGVITLKRGAIKTQLQKELERVALFKKHFQAEVPQ